MDYFIGLDLGQRRDFTAVAVVERVPAHPTQHNIRHLERVALGTSYTAVVERVCHLLRMPMLGGHATVVIDGTGVGVAVLDLFQRVGIRPVAITITGGL